MARDYLPVSCALHERLEFSVLRRIHLQVEYAGPAGRIVQKVLPLDVATRDGAEWLQFRTDDGRMEEIRLDRLIAAREDPG